MKKLIGSIAVASLAILALAATVAAAGPSPGQGQRPATGAVRRHRDPGDPRHHAGRGHGPAP